ncbi:MAG: hypothetical protein KC731_00760, partial [Myxococcales bacterium]|nr:hypothetical protein [Myxococcales bacterium]
AAKAFIDTKLTKHPSDFVQEGSKTVLVERYYGGRIGSKTSCSGYVSWGSETIFYGGPTGMMPGANPNADEKIDGGFIDVMDFAFTAYGVVSLPSGKGLMGALEWGVWGLGAAAAMEKYGVGTENLATASKWAGRGALGKDIGGGLARLITAGRAG